MRGNSQHNQGFSARLAGVLALACLVACAPTPTGTSREPRNAASPKPSAAPGTSPAPVASQAALPSTPPVVATMAPVVPGPAVVSVLAGRVSAPSALVLAAGGIISDQGAGILSNNAGNLIANNGGNIIANNSGSYRLLALAQVPLVGVPITLVDGSGAAVVGPDGKPVTAITDAEGRYAFSGVRPGRHLVVRAELPKVGSLSRIVAPQVADAPIDLASTLATTYILDQYVGSQADKQATLNRLPADVEAETVQIAAVAATDEGALVSLAAPGLVARVDALRAKDATFNAQLDKVKRLLILAGSSNLGAGEPATEVALRRFQTVWPLSDGRVYMQVADDGMLWRLDTDGRLRAVAGRAADGPGKAVTVGQAPLVVDARGRLLFGGEGGDSLWRLTPGETPADLKVENLTGGLVDVIAVCPLEGDAVLAFTWTPRAEARAWRLDPGVAPKQIISQTGSPPTLGSVRRAARLADGTVRVELAPFMVPYVATFDLATGATTKIKGWESGMVDFAMGIDGTVCYTAPGSDAVKAWTGGASDPVVPELKASDIDLFSPFATVPGAGYFMGGGFALSTKNATLQLRKGGVVTHLAGLTAEASAAGPGVVALTAPTAFCVTPEGDLLVVDNGVLVRVKPGGQPVPVFSAGLSADGATFKAAAPHVAPDGSYFLVAYEQAGSIWNQRDAVFRVTADGQATLVFRANGTIDDVVRGTDGSLMVAETDAVDLSNFLGHVVRITPDGTVAEVLPSAKANANVKAWLDGGQFVYAVPHYVDTTPVYVPKRMEADGSITTLPEVAGAPPFKDALGRSYTFTTTISRTDPVTGQAVVIAGLGGRVFTGSGVDDSIGTPEAPMFGPEGDLYFLDSANRQIKRIPKDKL